MLIREAKSRDLPVILDIMNEAILNTTSMYAYDAHTNATLHQWFIKKRLDKMPIFVCEVDHKAVAYSSFDTFRICDAYKFSVENAIYVHKDFRGRGIGKQLLNTLIDRAKKDGYHTMIAGIDSSNQGSYHFHEQLGFTEMGRFREVGYKFGRWLDLVFMQLMLA
ncbi:N-acetyltransferase family protein [Runella sp.]|uniref:GNAT family N-acetyltransferase n=1 Tax=Runella sp. TaxID=1960881 RepID=UPI003D0B844C